MCVFTAYGDSSSRENIFYTIMYVMIPIPVLAYKDDSADGDPHFLVNVAGSEHPLCFLFDGEDGQVLQLLHDSESGL